MKIQALPRKVLNELKKIYEHLNSKAYASKSVFTKRKVLNITVATVALTLVSFFMLTQVMSAIQLSSTISNVGTLKLGADMGVYSDAGLTNPMKAIDWGTLEPGTSKSYSVYIRNEGITALTLSMSASNWSPSVASNYLTLTWNYNGQTLSANKYVRVTFTLAVSASVTGISSFSFNINIVGTA